MDYKEKVIALLKSQELSKEQKKKLENLFPELKESEDERIRKELIDYHRSMAAQADDYVHEAWIAWLEKQGEQKPVVIIPKFRIGDNIKTTNEEPLTITKIDGKGYWSEDLFICGFDDSAKWELVERKPTDKVEPKFKVGDWVVISTSDGEKVVQIDSIEYFKSGEPRYITSEGRWFGNGTKAHLWTFQDAKDGDVIATEPIDSYPFPFVAIYKNHCLDFFNSHCFIGFNGKFYVGENGHSIENIHPATKEQHDLLFQKMKEAGYEWDAEKKELKKIEQKSQRMISAEVKEAMYDKPALSEEDELVIKDIEEAITNYWHGQSQEDLLDRLKSLKQRIGG